MGALGVNLNMRRQVEGDTLEPGVTVLEGRAFAIKVDVAEDVLLNILRSFGGSQSINQCVAQ